jgi:hypothetical protein
MDYRSHIKGIVHESNALIEKPPFVTFQLQNIIERNKCNCKVFFATMNFFFNYKVKNSNTTSQKQHSS